MQSFKQTFVIGAFEKGDKEAVLDAIENIENLEEKIAKKQQQRRPTKKENEDLKAAQLSLLQNALNPARRAQPNLPKDEGKPRLGHDSLKTIRALYIWIDSRLGIGGDVDEEELRARIDRLIKALKKDGVDFEPIKVEETPPLSFEQPGAPLAMVDENRYLRHADEVDWGSPKPSEYGEETTIKNEEDEAEVVSYLDWPHKVDMREFTLAGVLDKPTEANEQALSEDTRDEKTVKNEVEAEDDIEAESEDDIEEEDEDERRMGEEEHQI